MLLILLNKLIKSIMKKLFPFLSILILNFTIVFGQSNVYHPFPDSNAFWGIDGMNIFNYSLCYDARYGLNGDTIIDGKVYSKVYSLVDSTINNPNSTYFAAIREDDKRIYTVINGFPEEVLYDFNLSVSDTISFHYSLLFNSPAEFSRRVSQIDSVLLYNGEFRKRFVFEPIGDNSSTPDVVVEGVGSIIWRGLFNPLINAIATNGDVYSFECFKQNETIIFLDNPLCDHCFCTLETDIKKYAAAEKLLISPNPFGQQTIIRSESYLNNADLTIYNSFGLALKRISNISGLTIILNRENLPSGLYFLRLTQNNKDVANEKMVIISN